MGAAIWSGLFRTFWWIARHALTHMPFTKHVLILRHKVKLKTIVERLKAGQTEDKLDDIAPNMVWAFMGWFTIKKAQHQLGEGFGVLDDPNLSDGQKAVKLNQVLIEAVRLLDEQPE